MPVPAHSLPFGLRDVKLRPISVAGVVGASVDLPAGRTFSFSEAEDFVELRGDDKAITMRGTGASCDWDLEAGGISLDAYVLIAGGTITNTGVGPNYTKRQFRKKSTDQRPFFQVEGQAISDSGGDFHCIVYRCRATGGIEGELADGAFFLTSASGTGFPSQEAASIDALYDFILNEAEVAIA